MSSYQVDYKALVEGVNDYIYCIDLNGYFTYANTLMLETLGYRLDAIKKVHYTDIIRSDFREQAVKFYSDQISNGISSTYFEFPTIDINGAEQWIGQNVIVLSQEDEIIGFRAIARDITASKKVEMDYSTTTQALTSLIENLDSGVLVEDENGSISYINEQFCKIFHIRKPASKMIGASYTDLVEQSSYLVNDAEYFIERIYQLLEEKQVSNKEKVEFVNGKVYERSYVPMYEGGCFKGYFWKYNDISAQVQANLKQNRLASIVESSIDAILSVDFEGKIVTWNDGAKKMFLYEDDEIIGRPLMDIFFVENNQRSKSLSKLILAGKKISSFEQVGLKKNGHSVPLSISVSPIKNERESIIGFSVVASDISLAEKLKSQQDRFFELTLDLVCISDFEGNFKRVNPAFTKLLQYSEVELLNRPFSEFVHPDDIEKSYTEMGYLSNGNRVVGFENRYICKDGTVKWLKWSANVDPETGDFYAVARDITELKSILEEVDNYKYALNQSTILAITDPTGKITFVNDKFCEMTKYTREEVIGANHRILNSGHHSNEFFREMWECINSGQVWRGEVMNKAKDGETYWVDTTITPFLNDKGEVTQFIATRYNITKRKKNETALIKAKLFAEDSLKVKDEFIANMSHEIRTPMNAVIGFTDLLMETDLDNTQLNYLDTVKNSSELLLSLINDILDLSKLDEGRVVLENVPFNLESTLNKVFHLMEWDTKEKGLHFDLSIASETPLNFIGDPTRLEQIFLNLISNGIKFTEEGGVSMTVSPKYDTDDFANISFHVKDTGIGIPSDKLDQIFHLFDQGGQREIKHIVGGNGLGLAIVKGLTERLGGTVKIHSVVGEGTSVELIIPLKKDVRFSNINGDIEVLKGEINDQLGLRVLLVEDNHVNQLLAKTRLNRWGCEVDVALNGKEAIEKIREDHHLVLMDIQMPVMNGYETTVHIRTKMSPKIANIPIIAMSAHASNGDAIKAKKLGMNDYVFKPFKVDILFDKLQKWGLPRKKSFGEYSLDQEEKEIVVVPLENKKTKFTDLSFFKEETFGEKEIMIAIIESFLTEFDVFLTNASDGAKLKNWDKVYAETHKIKPSVSLFGIHDMLPLITDLDSNSRKKEHLKTIPMLITNCERIFKNVKGELICELENLQS